MKYFSKSFIGFSERFDFFSAKVTQLKQKLLETYREQKIASSSSNETYREANCTKLLSV